MTRIVLSDAFDHPFHVEVIDGDVTAQSDEAPVELVFTPASARATAERLLMAADRAEASNCKTPPDFKPPKDL